jgi:heterodisulfide reductase subunit D
MESVEQSQKRVDLAYFSLWQMLEMEACTRCGECIESCPTFAEARNEQIHPLEKIEKLKRFWKADHLGWLARLFGIRPASDQALKGFGQGVYQCTLCARCHVVCPVGIDTRELWISMREQLVAWNEYPEVFDLLRDDVEEKHNISGDDNSNRLVWTQNMERVPPGLESRSNAETVYFVGCVSALYPRVFGIPQSFVQIIEQVEPDFTTLGGDEWCCGFPLQIAGMSQQVQDLAHHNVESVRAVGARRLVTTCPSCYHVWAREYPRILGEPLGFQVLHATELFDEWIQKGQLQLNSVPQLVTYHDPCDLGRTSGIYDAPRRIIQAIPDIRFVEMADSRELSLCCGGGGDAEMADPELTAAVGKRRMEQAQEVGAQIVVSACQQCKRTLAEVARRNRVRIRVMDITELVWRAMQG